MSCFSCYVNSVPTQTSIHARRVAAGSVCGADLAGRWSNSGRWWGFCPTAWLLTRLLLLFKADNQFASVQGGATRRCSEVENKEILKMCNQDCFLVSIGALGTTATFWWRRGLKALTRECLGPQVTLNCREELDTAALLIWGDNPLKCSDNECRVTLKMSENPCFDVLPQCSAFSINRCCKSRLWFVGILTLEQTYARTYNVLHRGYQNTLNDIRILENCLVLFGFYFSGAFLA